MTSINFGPSIIPTTSAKSPAASQPNPAQQYIAGLFTQAGKSASAAGEKRLTVSEFFAMAIGDFGSLISQAVQQFTKYILPAILSQVTSALQSAANNIFSSNGALSGFVKLFSPTAPNVAAVVGSFGQPKR
jgi:hypothetical protein